MKKQSPWGEKKRVEACAFCGKTYTKTSSALRTEGAAPVPAEILDETKVSPNQLVEIQEFLLQRAFDAYEAEKTPTAALTVSFLDGRMNISCQPFNFKY